MLPPSSRIKDILSYPLQQLDRERVSIIKPWKKLKQERMLTIKVFGILAPIVGGAVFVYFYGVGLYFWLFQALMSVIVLANAYDYNKNARVPPATLNNLQLAVQQKAVSPVMRAWNAQYVYKGNDKIKEKEFIRSQLYQGYAHYQGKHYCKGTLPDGRQFKFSTLHVTGSNEKAYDSLVFKGLFIVLHDTIAVQGFDDLITIRSRYDILKAPKPSTPRRLPAPPMYDDQILDANLSPFTDETEQNALAEEVNRYYHCVSAAMRVVQQRLPEALCKWLLAVPKELKQYVSISFYKGKGYLAAPCFFDLLYPSVHQSFVSKENLEGLVADFELIQQLLEGFAAATIKEPSYKN